MPIIENFLKWALIIVVALMVLSGVGSAVFAGAVGLMSDPTFILIVFVGFLFFALLIVVPVALIGAWAWRWWQRSRIDADRRAEFIAPDEHGRLPVPASLLRQPAFANRAMDVHAASYMAGLHTFNYAPQHSQTLNGADGQTMTAAATATPGTFWQLYQSGALPDNGFLMGYSLDEDGEQVTADWRKLYSALIGGQSGSGKSTLIRGILAQSALQGGRFVVVDPHFGSGDESLGASLMALRPLMLCDVATDEKQIVDALGYVNAIGQRRLAGQDMDRSPIVLVVDETTALLQRSSTSGLLTGVLGQIAQETRKVGLFALCIGQNFKGTIMPTEVRDCFVSFISCRAKRRVAATMSGDNEFGKMAADLTTGQMVWMTPAGDVHRLAFPNCTAADLELVADHIFDGENTQNAENGNLQRETITSEALPRHFRGTSEPLAESYLERHFPKAEVGRKLTGSGSTDELSMTGSGFTDNLPKDDARAKRVIDAYLNGDSFTKIANEIYGVTGGRRYAEVREEIESILRSHMMRLGGN
jgi:hypothetical protein